MTIVMVAPDPAWPNEFQEIGLRLRAALGETALRIDHIGSTAVPGLAAKDVIDIQVTVANLDEVILALEEAGFTRREHTQDHQPPGMVLPDMELEKRLFVNGYGRRANVHIRLQGRFNQRYPLLCRDYLRTHPGAANAYAEIKRQLARYFPDDVEAYYDVKDPVFDLIMVGAEAWAQATTWQPGASDG